MNLYTSRNDIPEQYIERAFEPKSALTDAQSDQLASLFSRSKSQVTASPRPPARVAPDDRFVRVLMPGHSILVSEVLRSGIFALSSRTTSAQRALPKFDDVSDTLKGATVEYKGAPLVQAHLTVLLALIQLAADKHAYNAVINFDARDFLRSIHRSDCSRGIEALRDSLTSLRSATVIVKKFKDERGTAFGFVEEVDWDRRQVRVRLSSKLRDAIYTLQRTFVNLSIRNQLSDGVQTALHDLILSTKVESIDIAALAEQWGREPRELGREVRAALERMVEVGVLERWSKTRGRVHFVRDESYSR